MVNLTTLNTLVAAATPFIKINGAVPRDWRRNVQDKETRARGRKFRFEADFTVLDKAT